MGPQTSPGTYTAPSTLVGKGIYPIPEAARLSKVSPRRIRYWLNRFDSETARERHTLWQGELQPIVLPCLYAAACPADTAPHAAYNVGRSPPTLGESPDQTSRLVISPTS